MLFRGGGSGGVGHGWGPIRGCERRSEVFVKIQKIKVNVLLFFFCFFFWEGVGRGGGGPISGSVGGGGLARFGVGGWCGVWGM